MPGKPPLVTLRDAGKLIQRLPKAEALSTTWQAAIEALLLAAEERGPLMHAEVGLRKALHPREPVINKNRKDTHWGRRKLARDR